MNDNALGRQIEAWRIESPRLSRLMDIIAAIGCLELLLIMLLAPLVFRGW